MKKYVCVITLVLLATLTVNAQETKFGAKAGVNFSGLYGDSVRSLDGQTDFHIGGLANIGLNSWLALQPELVYSRQGYTYNLFGVEATGNLDYINVPVLVDFTVAKGLSLHGGPQFGFNLVGEEDTNAGTIDVEAKSFIVSNAIGAQYQLPDLGLFFQLRYASDFISVFEDNDIEAANSVFSVSVGWFFE